MEISFRDEKLRRLVSNENQLKRKFGRYARNVQLRFDLLREAKSLADVSHSPPPRRHRMKNTSKAFAIDVKAKADKLRIEFEVANDPVPRKDDGGIDLCAVTAVEIVAISIHYDD